VTSTPQAPSGAPHDADGADDAGEAFDVTVTRRPGVDVVTASGVLDLTTAVKLRHVLFDPVLCSQPVVVVHLDGVSFLDSTGIATLVAGRRWTVSRGARFVVVADDGPALRVLKLVKLHLVMQVWPELQPVLDALETR
jgi:anti-sigma B factor antagonist